MDQTISELELDIEPVDNERLANLCGPFNQHLEQIERRLGVQIRNRGSRFAISGTEDSAQAARELLSSLYKATGEDVLTPAAINLHLQGAMAGTVEADDATPALTIKTRRGMISGRGPNQAHYLESIRTHDVCFGVGPAGTGKTYLAVAAAVDALQNDRVLRLVLVRPAVEAGERLGFLPGDMVQKVDPYLRPLYDALYEMLGFENVARLIDRNVIEVAPLAFMRGRTLNDAFIILDEAQNTSPEQMKMFLTRIGFGSTAVITGDMTQIDLPKHQKSGLRHALATLSGINGIGITRFTARDVMRHPLVQKIVRAYEKNEREADGD